MGRVVKKQVDNIIGSKLSKENVLVTDTWRAYKTYAKEKELNITELNQTMANTLLRVCITSRMLMVPILE